VLTDEDVKARKAFADKYASRSETWWQKQIHMHIDVKHYKIYLNNKSRDYAAREGTRGAYRKRGDGLKKPYVKPAKGVKFNTGAKSVAVLAGVGDGKVLLWEYMDGKKWSGETAAAMYRGPVKKALEAQYPAAKRFKVLEDNDPSGFKSGKGEAAKADEGIQIFEIPKRSPCLNVCDYHLWHEVNRNMRAQEKSWPAAKKAKKETRQQYLRRLRKTAMALPAETLKAAVGDMRRRCARLKAAKGGNFEEGGK
jgi:hypothetical protein